MGLLSATNTITRYKIDGQVQMPLMETVTAGLKKFAISELEDEASDKTVGWADFEEPYQPGFDGRKIAFGSYLAFSMRVDKKNIPNKIVKKYCAIEMAKKLSQSDKEFLSANEKKMIKDHVINVLSLRIPATPNVYDILWKIEADELWFFSALKGANEEFESLFARSFGTPIIRLFPYTMAELMSQFSDRERDMIKNLSPTSFVR